jgi:ATP citrate (pro-S)-lyase
MNTIVASRAGKDLISSLASGLLTIGSRFGGALDEAAAMFSNARDTGLTPREFVDNSRKANKLISGIGHKIKSVNNPDLRVELVKEYVQKNFPSHSLLDYALAVEKVTTAKKDTVRSRSPLLLFAWADYLCCLAYSECGWMHCRLFCRFAA